MRFEIFINLVSSLLMFSIRTLILQNRVAFLLFFSSEPLELGDNGNNDIRSVLKTLLRTLNPQPHSTPQKTC